ncbi:MAG: hypothetical protein J5699_06985 [Bacteroidales bacterium]|nr:hypothetical protein [Bacteroidales bacterium]
MLIVSALCALMLTAVGCGENLKPMKPEEKFTLDSYNGHFAQAISDAYDVFEETGSLPTSVNVEGITYNKGRYTIAACLLIDKIVSQPDTWQDEEIDLFSAAFGDEYRWNTYDPDVIDFAHIKYMAGRMADYARNNGSLPNYVTFPSSDQSSPGYMPKLLMVVTEHDNMMNLRAAMVVLARTMNYFVKNEGKWPEEVSSWPSSYLAATRNCPKDDELVKSTLAAALKNLSASATERQKAEAIFAYARDEWEWENYSNTKKGALGTIRAKGGNCCDLTHATLAMCRAAGIPARYLHGQCYFTSGVIGHVIPEIYVDGKWWICDPSNNSATFGTPTWKGMETFNGRYYELEF